MPRRLSSFIHLSLDGYYCDARGDMSFAQKPPTDTEWADFTNKNASGNGALLFGRVTYAMMAAWWPTPAAAQRMPDVAAGMNRMPKYVASRTLTSADWSNTTLLTGDLSDAIRRLKNEDGPDLAILGSGSIVAQLAQAKLIDRLQLVINPLVLGSGKSLFNGVSEKLPLKLESSRQFNDGAVLLTYSPA
jgi:dihydrofolate reductase